MRKNTFMKKWALSFICISTLFMSCEVGLGSAIDTEPPAISITNPPSDSIIRSNFALMGKWSDDGTIASVYVTLRNLETSEKYGPYEAVFAEPEDDDEEQGTWSCYIDPVSKDYGIPDGNYESTVEIKDKGEHVTRVNRSFAIDNTPPVVVLERPGSVVGSESMDTYGRNVTIEGMAADDHDVSSIVMAVYEDKGFSKLLEKVTISNVPPTISLPLAYFEEGKENAYSQMYGSTSIKSDPAQTRYCKISAYDSAIKYPLDGSDPSEEDKKGNEVNYYYLKDTLSTANILNDDCKITDIYHILSGTKEVPDANFMSKLQENQVEKGAFILNPKNNPTYSVSVRKPLTKSGKDFDKSVSSDYVLYKGSPLTIEVSAGLDNYGMKNIRPYAIKCDAKGEPLADAKPVYLDASSGDAEVTTYKWTTVLTDEKGLENDTCYVVEVEGTDSIGNPILPKEIGYGFYFDTKANVSIENLSLKINGGADVINSRPIYLPAKNPANTNANSVVEVSGSVLSTSGTPYLYINVEEVQAAVIQLTAANKDASWDAAANNGKFKYNFTASFNTSIIPAKYNDKEATLTVKLVNGSATKIETKKLSYDCTAPEIKTFNLNPVAKKYDDAVETGPINPDVKYLNQTVSFDYSVKNEGNQLSKVLLKVYSKAAAASEWTAMDSYTKEFTSDFENITGTSLGTINTSTITDGSNLKVELSVWDKAGNKNVKEVVYTVDSTTDNPAVLPSDATKSTLRIAKANIKTYSADGKQEPDINPNKKNHLETGTPLSLVAYDDDGIKSVKVEVETLTTVTKEPGGIKEYAFDVTLPGKANTYEVKVTVTDTNDTSKTYTFGVRVVTTQPIVTLTKTQSVVSTNSGAKAEAKTLTATVKVNSDQPNFTVVRKIKQGNNVVDSYTKTFDENFTDPVKNTKVLKEDSPELTDVINFTPVTGFGNGVYTLEYVVTDTAGKSGSVTDTFSVDNTAPEVSQIDEFNWLDNRYINKSSYTFSGKANDGNSEQTWQSGINKIEYSFDNSTWTTAAGTTDWKATADFNSLFTQEGKKSIWVRAVDEVGNVSAVKQYEGWYYDKAAPEASIDGYIKYGEADSSAVSSTFYYGKSFAFTGTASDTNPEALKSVILYQNKGKADEIKIEGTNITLTGSTWKVTGLPYTAVNTPTAGETAANGTYTYDLEVTDASGKKSVSSTKTLIVDHDDPKKADIVWSDSGKVTPAGTSNIVLEGATYKFAAKAEDNGIAGLEKITFIVKKDGSATSLFENDYEIDLADKNAKKTEKTYTLSTAKLLGTGITDANADLPEGKYTITVKSYDYAGNSSESDPVTFYVDQKAPVLTANAHDDVGKAALTSAGKKVTLTGTLTETYGLASAGGLTVSGGKKATITYTGSTWTITDEFKDDGTEDGKYTYTVTAKDIVGRTATCEAKVTIDTKAPVIDASKIDIPVTDFANGKADTEKSSFRFTGNSGNLSDGEASKSSGLKQIYFIFADAAASAPENKSTEAATDAMKSFSLTPKSDGTWSSLQTFASYSSVFAADKQGNKKLWIKAYDNAGNSSNWQALDFVYDTAKPTVSENGLNNDNTKQNGDFTLKADASDGWGIESVVLTVKKEDGTVVTPEVAPESAGGRTWKITKGTYGDGKYNFVLTATDKAGKQTTAVRKVTIDATAPEVQTVTVEGSNVNGIYTAKTLTYVVTPNDDVSGIAGVWYSLDSKGAASRNWIDMIYQTSGDYKASITFKDDGVKNVYFKIKDNAGNVRGENEDHATKSIEIDTTAPTDLKVYDSTGTEITAVEIIAKGNSMTGATDLTYYLKATDSNGIRGIVLGYNQTISSDITPVSTPVASSYKVTIAKANLASGDVYFTVCDKLGNKTSYSPFSLKVDNEVPEVVFTEPKTTTGLNGKVKIAVKITDHLGAATGNPNDGKVESIKFEYSKTGTGSWKTIDSNDTITSGLSNTTEIREVEHSFSSYNKLYNTVLGETDDSTGKVYVRVTATDEAGNEGSNTLELNLDRDKDRPTIVFDSVNLTGTSWLTGTTVLSGTITDDDEIGTLEIKSVDSEDTTHDWRSVDKLNKNSGAWSYDIQHFYGNTNSDATAEKANLPRTIYFRYQNKESADGSKQEYFQTESSSTLHGIYIKGSDGAQRGAIGENTGENTVLSLNVDTLDPKVSIEGIHVGAISSTGDAVAAEVSAYDYDGNFGDITLGGDDVRQFQIKIEAKDTNGIKDKTVAVDFDEVTVESKAIYTSTTEDDMYIAAFELDFSDSSAHKSINGKNGNLKIRVTATDNADNDTERSKDILYDFKKPEIKITRPLETATSSGSVKINGMLEDNTGVPANFYYAISTSNTISPFADAAAASSAASGNSQIVKTWTGKNPDTNAVVNQATTIMGKARGISIKPYYKSLNPGLTWYLDLDGNKTVDNHDQLLNEFIQEFNIASYNEINSGDTRFDTIVNLYLWVKAVDSNGNSQVLTHLIQVDPQGMRPSLTVEAPVAGSTLGGAITINGTAEPKGTNVMKTVHIQVKQNGTVVTGYDDYKVNTNGSVSWSTNINSDRTMEGKYSITIWAEDDQGNLSLKETRTITVDRYSPVIESVFFRTRSGDSFTGKITSSKEHSNSAYIGGEGKQWFLEIKVTDAAAEGSDGSIKEFKLLDKDGNEITTATGDVKKSTETKNNHIASQSLQFKLPCTSGFGEKKYTIVVKDDANGEATRDITVNYDFTKPVLQTAEQTNYNINHSVVQTNGFYTLGSQVFEDSDANGNQSGLDFVAFYFRRSDKIYDVMRHRENVEVKDGEYVIGSDGLPWKEYSITGVDSDTLTLASRPAHVYKGGLVKVNDVVFVISDISEDNGSTYVNVKGTLDTEAVTTSTKVYFALASVVDNTIQENKPQNPDDAHKRITDKTKDFYGYYPEPDNDDGDHMIERVTTEGVWEALINSTNIPDGTIEIHYVAFDKAGNYNAGSVTGTDVKVANNQPRIAGAKIYIDYNGNGQFDDNDLHKVVDSTGKVTYNKQGEITVYNHLNNQKAQNSVTKKDGDTWYFDPNPDETEVDTTWKRLPGNPTATPGDKDQGKMTLGTSEVPAFVMKGKTKILPEIVGGNGNIYYSYKNSTEALKGSNTTKELMTGTTDNTIGTVTNPIVIQVGDLLKMDDTDSDLFTFTFKDSTDGGSLETALEFYAGVDVRTTTAPTVTIKPFYWKNLRENSVFIDNLGDYEDDVTYEDIWADTKGHIELEADWKNTTSYSGTTGEYDGDPKVSGIIVIEGTVTDSLRVEELIFTLPGMGVAINGTVHDSDTQFTLASIDSTSGILTGFGYNEEKGIWFDADKGVGLELTTNRYTQEGHYIEWKLIWDTQKIAGTAMLDAGVSVIAKNVGTLKQSASGTGETGLDGTTVYNPIISSDQQTNTPGTTSTATNAETAYYRMDIVPYIQYLNTKLAKKKSGHPSVYGRTAGGAYPVYYYSTKFSSGSEGETYTFEGFNILDGSKRKTVTSSSTSRALEISYTANGNTVKSLNNVNLNTAEYNKQPNGINNNNLNDDVEVKIWVINSKAKTSSKGDLTEAKMHSNNGTLGYAYIHNGGMTYQLDSQNSDDAISTYENIDFIFDKNGNKLGIYCGTNYNGYDVAGRMKLVNSSWVTSSKKNIDKDEARNNTIDLESMAYWNSGMTDTVSAPRRFAAPKLASSTNSNKDNVYLLYYDTVMNKLKFRAGQTYNKSGFGTFTNLETIKHQQQQNDKGQMEDINALVTPYESETNKTARVEYDSWNTAKVVKTATAPITYYSLAVVSGTATDGKDDKVVAAWVENKKLYYAYCANPLEDTPTWKILEVKKLSGKASGVCAIAVDPNKQVHIAAYSTESTGSLTYTYLKSYNALGSSATEVPAANTVYVDKYGTTGEFLTMDFAINASGGNYVPYISYYSNEMPKLAYMLGDGNKNKADNWKPSAGVAGADGTGDGSFYTTAWEQIMLPTSSPVLANNKNNNINIALTRKSATDGEKKTTSGPANTDNPVLGYAINYQGLGYLETAQLK